MNRRWESNDFDTRVSAFLQNCVPEADLDSAPGVCPIAFAARGTNGTGSPLTFPTKYSRDKQQHEERRDPHRCKVIIEDAECKDASDHGCAYRQQLNRGLKHNLPSFVEDTV